MAFPLALLGLGLSVAGGVASHMGAKRSAQAQANVWNSFRERNAKRQQEGDEIFRRNLEKSGADTADREIDLGAQRRESAYAKLDRSASPAPVQGTTNRMVQAPARGASVKNAGNAWSRLLGKAQARLGGRADWLLNQNVRDQRTTQELNRVSNFARGDLNNVVPVELNAAARKGDSLRGWGSLLSAAGMLAGTAGALGVGAGSGGGTVAQRAAVMKANPELGAVFTGENSIWGSLIPK